MDDLSSAKSPADSPPESVTCGHTDLWGIPQPIWEAVVASGILDDDRDIAWLHDPLTLKCLAFAHDAHYGQRRKKGGEARLIHEIWCAHEIHNNIVLNQWLDTHHIPRQWALLGMILHDAAIENRRDWAENNGEQFDQTAALEDVRILLDNQPLFNFLSDQCFSFMTDAPGLKKQDRINAQKAKAYNTSGKFILTPLQQAWRITDKFCHNVLDARICLKQLFDIANKNRTGVYDDTTTKAKLSELQTSAAKCLGKAVLKSFAFTYPAAENGDIRLTNQQAVDVLKNIAGSLRADLLGTFGDSANAMLLAFQKLRPVARGQPFRCDFVPP